MKSTKKSFLPILLSMAVVISPIHFTHNIEPEIQSLLHLKLNIFAFANSTSDFLAPSIPTALKAEAASKSEIHLTWSASLDNVGIAGYKVFRNNKQIAITTNASFADIKRTPATTYSYAVAAFDTAGNTSPISATAIAKTFTKSLRLRTIYTSTFAPSSPDPNGITYLPDSGEFMITDSEVEEMKSLYSGANIFKFSQTGELLETSNTLCFSNEPTGITRKKSNGHLFFSDDNQKRIFEVAPGADGLVCTADDESITSIDLPHIDVEDVVYDQKWNIIYVGGGYNIAVYKIVTGPDNIFGTSDDKITSFNVAQYGLKNVEGLAMDPVSRNLFLIGDPRDRIVQLKPDGTYVRTIDITSTNSKFPAGMTFAPSSVDPTVNSLYLTDRGIDNNFDSTENDGKVYEISFPSDSTK